MIDNIIDEMNENVKALKDAISLDIEDVKNARHEELLNRNDLKQVTIDNIMTLKAQLNQELVKLIQDGVDVNIYRDKIDTLETQLRELYDLNRSLASIVLPVQQMYKDLVEKITNANGGVLFDVKA